jgi:hypothetical protein
VVLETTSFFNSGIFEGVSNILGETPVLTTYYFTSLLLRREALKELFGLF